MSENTWSLLGSEPLRDYRVLRIREDKYRFGPTGAVTGFVVCDSADWVLVIPLTVDKNVVFVRQFRHGLGEVVLEIPGGVMEPGETPAATAARAARGDGVRSRENRNLRPAAAKSGPQHGSLSRRPGHRLLSRCQPKPRSF